MRITYRQGEALVLSLIHIWALAQALFGSEDALIRLDMSEFSEGHSVSRLIGSPPGYVGHEEGGQLTEEIRRHPYSVVLFDELEKANDQVWNLLLQILEDGALTDAQGKKADFRNAVLILTSNLGAQAWANHPLGFGTPNQSDYEKAVRAALRKTFRPEFLNRLDEVICFAPLTGEQVAQIAQKMLSKTARRLEQKGVTLTVLPGALEVLGMCIRDRLLPDDEQPPLDRADDRQLPAGLRLGQHQLFLYRQGLQHRTSSAVQLR